MKSERIYLNLVRAALWGKEPVVWPEEMTEDLLRLNAHQGTGALVYPLVLNQESLSSYARTQMKGVCMRTMQQHVQLQYTLQTVWQALEKANIQAVLMKGASLAALYPDPHQRAWGDIDLFVGKDQYHPACAVMRDTFPKALKFDEELDHYKHYNIIADGISIETHRVTVGFQHPVDERRYAKMEAYGMMNAEWLMVNGLKVRVFEPTFNALFVMIHAWEHMTTQGANVRQLCDLSLLLHHYAAQIDRKRLKRYLKDLHLTDVWALFMTLCVNDLGLPEEEAPLYDPRLKERAALLMNHLLSGKLVAPKPSDKAPEGRILRKMHTMTERLHNARRIGQYSPAYGRHMVVETLLHGALRFFAKDRHWE